MIDLLLKKKKSNSISPCERRPALVHTFMNTVYAKHYMEQEEMSFRLLLHKDILDITNIGLDYFLVTMRSAGTKEFFSSLLTAAGLAIEDDLLAPAIAMCRSCAACVLAVAPAAECVAKLRECTAHVMMVNRTSDPAWCTAARGTGTYSSRVEMPSPTWTIDIPATEVRAMRVAAGAAAQ